MYEIDRTDIDIINLLGEDGRLSCSEIARRLGHVSARSVRYRLDRLLEEGIIDICAIPKPEKLGYPVVADVFIEVESAHILDVARALAAYNWVSYVGCAIGKPDVSVQIFAPDNAAVYAHVTEVIAKLPGVVSTRTVILPLILKDSYQWRVPNPPGGQRKGGRTPPAL